MFSTIHIAQLLLFCFCFREIFQDMSAALDPSNLNPEITIEDFQSALKFCINKMTVKTEDSWLLDVSSHKMQLAQHPNSPIITECKHV